MALRNRAGLFLLTGLLGLLLPTALKAHDGHDDEGDWFINKGWIEGDPSATVPALPGESFAMAAALSPADPSNTTSEDIWGDYLLEPDNHAHIPNNSFAGYMRGEQPLPDVPVVTDITYHGGVGDGLTDNTTAFRDAIEAAYQAGGGAVYIPAGTWLVTETIWLWRSGVVLRGAGQGQTIIRFSQPLVDIVGEINPTSTNIWSWSGGLIWMAPRDEVAFSTSASAMHKLDTRDSDQGYSSSSNPWEYWRIGSQLATVTQQHERGDRTIQVNDAGNLHPGMLVLMSWDNNEDQGLWEEITQHPSFQAWPDANFGTWFVPASYPRWLWPVEIAAVDGNAVTLCQPLRVSTKPEFNVTLWNQEVENDYIQQSGVENLTIELEGIANGSPYDLGWNGVYLNRTYNCWVRNVEVVNGNNGFHVSAAKNCTLLDTTVRGDRWTHHPYTNRCMSADVLYDGITVDISEDSTGGTHGLNTEFLSTGTVYSRATMNRGTFDTHRAMSFDLVRTGISLRNEDNSNPGGSVKAGPYAGRRLVHWNVDVDSDRTPDASGTWAGLSNTGLYVYQPDIHSFGALVGIKGTPVCEIPTWSSTTCSVMPCGDKDVLVADHGATPAITNLYDAELAERSARESWIHFTSPTQEVVGLGEAVTLAVSANAGPNTIQSVSFRVDGLEVDSDTTFPFETTWAPPSRGLYSLSATFTDNLGNTVATRSPRWLTVGERMFLNHNHPAIDYSGTWTEEFNTAYFKGNANYVQAVGSSAELIFRGTRIQLYSTGESSHKVSFTVYLDDMVTPSVSKSIRGRGGYRHLAWDSGILADQPHRVRIVSDQRLVVDGFMVDSTSDTIQLVAPVAAFTATPPNGLPPLGVTFNGAASYDPDGSVVEYRWDFGDGTPQFVTPTPLASHTYTELGEYTVVLTVVDNDGVTDQQSGTVFVGNLDPTASFTATPASGNPPLLVTLDGTASTDADGTIVSWEWDFNNDGTVDDSGQTTTTTFSDAGIHVIRLTVTDNLGGTGTTTRQVTVDGLFAPVILSQPVDYATYAGFDGFFEVEVGGNPEPSLQWYRDGLPVSGATLPLLQLNNLSTDDDGAAFYLLATNSEGTAQSDTVVLSVVPPPEGTSVKLVDWGGDYVTATRDWQRLEGGSRGEGVVGEYGDDGLMDDKVKRLPYSDTLEVSPVIGTDYSGASARFYGGGEVWRVDATDKVLWRYVQVREKGLKDDLYFSMTNSDINHDFLALLWKQEDFLNLSLSTIVFNETSRLYANVTGSDGAFPKIRFMVRNGDQLYISNAFQDGAGEFELSSSALRDALWAPYDPDTNIQPVPGETGVQSTQLAYTVTTPELDNLTAFGFFCERYAFPAGGNNNMAIEDFEVYAAPAGSGGFNQAPSVTLLSPGSGSFYTEPASVTVIADAEDADGSIASVEIFVDDVLVDQLVAAPYDLQLTGLMAGTYTIQAVAEDDDGARTTSEPVSITVNVPALTVTASSWLGGAGSDVINAARIQSDGTVVLAGTVGTAQPGGVVPFLIDGATNTSDGIILRLAADGKSVLSATRLPATITDMAIDSADNIYVAAPNAGLYKLNSSASSVVYKRLDGQFVYRLDASAGGIFAGMVPEYTSNPDTATGTVNVSLFNSGGTLLSESGGPTQNTLDLCIDEISQTLITIGWRQTSASGEDNVTLLPVQIAALRGRDFGGVEKWTNYNWESGPYDPANTSHLNTYTSNMADSRGLLCTIGDDGLLYAGFEVAGGNHIMRWDPTDLSVAVSITGGDMWHNFSNTASEHKAFVGRYDPATGDYLLGQQFATRFWDGLQDRGNAFRLTGGDLYADGLGRVYLGGASASGLPMPPVHGYVPGPESITFNPLPDPVYTGGAYFLMMSSDFSTRRFLTRLGGGTTRAVHARTLEGDPNPLVVFAGAIGDINVNWNGIGTTVGGEDPVDNRKLLYTLDPIQPVEGGGTMDGFFALVETRDPGAPVILEEPPNVAVAEGTILILSVAVTANPAATFQWRRNGVDLPFEVASSLMFTAAAGDDGALYSCVVTNEFGSVETAGAQLDVLAGATDYATWIDSFYPGQTDPLVIGPESDPDHDGLASVLEFFLGLLPNVADSGGALSVHSMEGQVHLVYRQSKQAAGLTYWVEWSTDLDQWWDDDTLTITEIDDFPQYKLMQASAPVGARRMLRLSVQLP